MLISAQQCNLPPFSSFCLHKPGVSSYDTLVRSGMMRKVREDGRRLLFNTRAGDPAPFRFIPDTEHPGQNAEEYAQHQPLPAILRDSFAAKAKVLKLKHSVRIKEQILFAVTAFLANRAYSDLNPAYLYVPTPEKGSYMQMLH